MYQVLFSTQRIALKTIVTIAIGISENNPLDKTNDWSFPPHSTRILPMILAIYIKRRRPVYPLLYGLLSLILREVWEYFYTLHQIALDKADPLVKIFSHPILFTLHGILLMILAIYFKRGNPVYPLLYGLLSLILREVWEYFFTSHHSKRSFKHR